MVICCYSKKSQLSLIKDVKNFVYIIRIYQLNLLEKSCFAINLTCKKNQQLYSQIEKKSSMVATWSWYFHFWCVRTKIDLIWKCFNPKSIQNIVSFQVKWLAIQRIIFKFRAEFWFFWFWSFPAILGMILNERNSFGQIEKFVEEPLQIKGALRLKALILL